MITTDEKLKLKELLGVRYGYQVLDILMEKEIYNREGKPYKTGYVNHVLNGRNENFKIEAAIFELFKQRSDFIKNLEIARKQVV